MSFETFLITIVLPALIAGVVTYFLNKRFEKQRRKRMILSDVMAFRKAITTEASLEDIQHFFAAVNRIVVEFDNKNINSALRNFRNAKNSKESTKALNDLFGALLKDAGIKNIDQNDELIQFPFHPTQKP